jgi:hypothetical protein
MTGRSDASPVLMYQGASAHQTRHHKAREGFGIFKIHKGMDQVVLIRVSSRGSSPILMLPLQCILMGRDSQLVQ